MGKCGVEDGEFKEKEGKVKMREMKWKWLRMRNI